MFYQKLLPGVGNSSSIHIAEQKTLHSRKLPLFIDIVDGVLNQTLMVLNCAYTKQDFSGIKQMFITSEASNHNAAYHARNCPHCCMGPDE